LVSASYILFTVGAMIVWFPHHIAGPVQSSGIQPLAGLLLTIVAIGQCVRAAERREIEAGIAPECQAL
jgi:hypothetical protein